MDAFSSCLQLYIVTVLAEGREYSEVLWWLLLCWGSGRQALDQQLLVRSLSEHFRPMSFPNLWIWGVESYLLIIITVPLPPTHPSNFFRLKTFERHLRAALICLVFVFEWKRGLPSPLKSWL